MKTITIKTVDKKTSSKGTPYLFVVDVEGNRYSVWDTKLMPRFQVSNEIEIAVDVKDTYTNIIGAKVLNGAEPDLEELDTSKQAVLLLEQINTKLDALSKHLGAS